MYDEEVAKRHPFLARLIDAAGEIGILQITFSPLDWVFESHAGTGDEHFAIGFAVVGILLLGISILGEWFLSHD